MQRLQPALAALALALLACASTPAPSGGAGSRVEGGRLVNPTLADGTPVMMGYDSHHPDCFTFPEEGKESAKVECPEGALSLLHDCRGAKLYATRAGCRCVPVSDEPASDIPCPDGVEAADEASE